MVLMSELPAGDMKLLEGDKKPDPSWAGEEDREGIMEGTGADVVVAWFAGQADTWNIRDWGDGWSKLPIL